MSLRDKLSKAKDSPKPQTRGEVKNPAGRPDVRAGDFTQKPEKPAPAVDFSEESVKTMAQVRKAEPAIRKIVRVSAALADQLTDEDRLEMANVIRRCMRATNTHYDPKVRRAVETPDYRIQLAAATLGLAYIEGLPVKRIAAVVADARSVEDRIANLQDSPEMANALRSIAGIGGAIELEGEILEIDAEETVQETPTENDDVA